MIAYDCDPRFVCTGPAPFDANETPCCDEHEEEWTRGKVADRTSAEPKHWLRLLANAVGVDYDDMRGFVVGRSSLTYPARVRIRGVLE